MKSRCPDSGVRWRCAALLPLVMLCNGCGLNHIRELREAEQTFSRAAEQDNRARLSPLDAATALPGAAPDAVTSRASDTIGYRLAAEMTRKLISGSGTRLRADNLLCTAYVVRSFSLWRLGEGAAAADAAATDCGSTTALPRERVLLQIVPALVEIDEANALLSNATRSSADFDRTKELVISAAQILGSADDQLPRDHPLRGYLFQSRLAAARVAFSSPTLERLPGAQEGEERGKALDAAATLLQQYRRYLYCHAGFDAQTEHGSVKYWRRLFGDAIELTPSNCSTP